jgi:hypothetical protein
MPVVIEPSFLVEILPRESQVLREDAQVFGIGFRRGSSKRLGYPAPSDFAVFVGDDSGGIEVVGVEEVDEGWVGGDGVGGEHGYWRCA